ncbi:hypothetical protein JTF08_10210 [Micrococcaceae bacterium RIT802]|nr:hypothetical protein [Micrococcaceae bacterium RIT 802]
MSATAQKCRRCDAVLFPARLLCPGCGGDDFGRAVLDKGTVEQSTTLSDGTVMATVLPDGGPRLIARIYDTAPGGRVALTHDPAAGPGHAYVPIPDPASPAAGIPQEER